MCRHLYRYSRYKPMPCMILCGLVLFVFYTVINKSVYQKGLAGHAEMLVSPIMEKQHQVYAYDFLKENLLRKKKINKACLESSYQIKNEEILESNMKHMFVEEKTKLFFCEIPKVASSNIRRLLLLLSGKTNFTNMKEMMHEDVHDDKFKPLLPSLHSFSKEERAHKLRTYTKFMFVRHPLERILSAYRSKFGGSYNEFFSKRYGREIIKRFRNNPSKESLEYARDVKFSEFVQYIIQTKGEELERHWQEYHRLCHPCIIDYDFVGEYENFQEDINSIIARKGINNHFIPNDYDKKGRPPTSNLMAEAYKKISQKHVRELYQTFYTDHIMFGYNCTFC